MVPNCLPNGTAGAAAPSSVAFGGQCDSPGGISDQCIRNQFETCSVKQDRCGRTLMLDYDLTFPMTSVPLGRLRPECGEWRSDRWYRPLGVAPFLLPVRHDVWPAHAEFLQVTFQVPHIYCLHSVVFEERFELWSKRFRDWTDADWHDPENLSILCRFGGWLPASSKIGLKSREECGEAIG